MTDDTLSHLVLDGSTMRIAWFLYYKETQSVHAVTQRFHISHKTFYKWLKRYKNGESLADHSRRPKNFPRATPAHVVDTVLAVRRATGFGQRRLRRTLCLEYGVTLSERTIWKILKAHQEELQRHTDHAESVENNK
jgi:transposase